MPGSRYCRIHTRVCGQLFVVVLLTGHPLHAAELPESLRNVHIASRLQTGRIMIRGGWQENDTKAVEILQGQKDVLRILKVTPAQLKKRLTPRPAIFRLGDKWKIYTGAGAALEVVIQEIVPSDDNEYPSAFAQFEDANTANRVNGLRASEYLAAPAPGIPQVSVQPLLPFDKSVDTDKYEKVLLHRSRMLLKGREWNAPHGSATLIERLDSIFLKSDRLRDELHMSRWSLPGRKPLLFAEIVWRSENREAVFGANAVMEDGEIPKILDFDSRPAEEMRVGSEQADTWDDYDPVFPNAWAIGGRMFVLKFTQYYEGISEEIMEIVSGRGLVPTGIGYGSSA